MSFDKLAQIFPLGPNSAEAISLYTSRLPGALLTTCIVTLGAAVVALVVGVLLALGRSSRVRAVSVSVAAIIYIARCVPLPPLQLLAYFVLLATFRLDAIYAGMLGLGIFYAPPMAEVFRSGISSVPPGQVEAAMALGMGFGKTRRRVIVPIALRLMLPAIGQLVVGILITSAFVSQIGMKDITGMARNIINALFSSDLWLVVAVTYFVIAFPLSRLFSWLERRLAISM